MKSQQAVASRKCYFDARRKDAWQISAVSDSVSLALIMEEKELFRDYENVFVKLPTRYAAVRVLHERLKHFEISVFTFVRLYCTSGNDYCARCCIASPKKPCENVPETSGAYRRPFECRKPREAFTCCLF